MYTCTCSTWLCEQERSLNIAGDGLVGWERSGDRVNGGREGKEEKGRGRRKNGRGMKWRREEEG